MFRCLFEWDAGKEGIVMFEDVSPFLRRPEIVKWIVALPTSEMLPAVLFLGTIFSLSLSIRAVFNLFYIVCVVCMPHTFVVDGKLFVWFFSNSLLSFWRAILVDKNGGMSRRFKSRKFRKTTRGTWRRKGNSATKTLSCLLWY